jgi:hypothetical protein
MAIHDWLLMAGGLRFGCEVKEARLAVGVVFPIRGCGVVDANSRHEEKSL